MPHRPHFYPVQLERDLLTSLYRKLYYVHCLIPVNDRSQKLSTVLTTEVELFEMEVYCRRQQRLITGPILSYLIP